MFELVDTQPQEAVIKVVGVGGCGGNAVDHMIDRACRAWSSSAPTPTRRRCRATRRKTQLQLGSTVTKGLGAGANPEVGRQAALEDRERIIELIEGADMLFITAGMGGGTGTGAAPVVAEVARELGILTVAVVTKPFAFEGKRLRVAHEGLEALTQHVDSLIVIPNEKLMQVLGDDVTHAGRLQGGQRRAARRGRRHRRGHQLPRHGQRRLRRRAHGDVARRAWR